MSKTAFETLDDRGWRFVMLALMEAGDCTRSIAEVLVKGQHADTAHQRGNIASGFERAAAYVRGHTYDPTIPPEHQK